MPGEKIMVGMSGGVDSSVCTALLIKKDYDVTGATLRLYDNGNFDAADAKAVCEKLGIEHYIFDFRELFKDNVLNNFTSEYYSGRTPNPCIVCNRKIKFGAMLDKAKEMGFDKVATGHYASVKKTENGRYLLCRAADLSKDQTYVLYSLTQEQLSRVIFPLNEVSKPEVRKIAESLGFQNADKPDSQDICFVPDGDYATFIESFCDRKSLSGDFVNENGDVLGKHSGIIRYTIGQRKGLGIALGKPAFVLDKDINSNCVTLGDEEGLFYRRVLISNTNFIPFDKLENPICVTAKLRYRHIEQKATVYPADDGNVIIEFDQPQRAPSPGQAAVFYDDEIVVGGGTIVKGLD